LQQYWLLLGWFLELQDPKHASLDPIGGVLSIAGLVALVYAIIEALRMAG